jgi:hypothetical protein
LITAQITGDLLQHAAGLTARAQRLRFILQALDDVLRSTRQEVEQLGFDPDGAIRIGFAERRARSEILSRG